MIVPGDFTSFTSRYFFKISWVILFLNFAVFALISINGDEWPSAEIQQKMTSDSFKKSVYEMYLQTLDPIEIQQNESVDKVFS